MQLSNESFIFGFIEHDRVLIMVYFLLRLSTHNFQLLYPLISRGFVVYNRVPLVLKISYSSLGYLLASCGDHLNASSEIRKFPAQFLAFRVNTYDLLLGTINKQHKQHKQIVTGFLYPVSYHSELIHLRYTFVCS